MPISFKKVDPVEELDAEVLLAEILTARQKKPVTIRAMMAKQGGVAFGNFRGTAGGGIVTKILTEYMTRVIADGGTIEGANCVKSVLYKLSQ